MRREKERQATVRGRQVFKIRGEGEMLRRRGWEGERKVVER